MSPCNVAVQRANEVYATGAPAQGQFAQQTGSGSALPAHPAQSSLAQRTLPAAGSERSDRRADPPGLSPQMGASSVATDH
eukprot:10558597-Alexandrium_andersonii.AAC.1